MGRIKKKEGQALDTSTTSRRSRKPRPVNSRALVPYIPNPAPALIYEPRARASDVSVFWNKKKTGIQEGKYWQEAASGDDMFTAWDLFTLNRFAPASTASPYVNNMTLTPVPTGTFRNSFSISSCYNSGTGVSAPLGTAAYTVIMYCPSLSSWGGGPGGSFFPATTRLGGFIIYQSVDLSATVSPPLFATTNFAYSSVQLYGSDFSSFASGGFVWSGQIDFRIVCPAANLTGAVYKGAMTFNQLGASPTLGNLLQNSQYVSTGEYEASVRSAVVEPALIEDITATLPVLTSTGKEYQGADNEVVSYLIYQTPVQSITTGATTFSLIANQRGNFAYYPKTTDPLAFSLGQQFSKPHPPLNPANNHPGISAVIAPRVNAVVNSTAETRSHQQSLEALLNQDDSMSWTGDSHQTGWNDSRSNHSLTDNTVRHPFGSTQDVSVLRSDLNSSQFPSISGQSSGSNWNTASVLADGASELGSMASALPGLPGRIASVVGSVGSALSRIFSKIADTTSTRQGSSMASSQFSGAYVPRLSSAHDHNRSPPQISKIDLRYHLRQTQDAVIRFTPLNYSQPYFNDLVAWFEDFGDWLDEQPELIPLSAVGPPMPGQLTLIPETPEPK